MEKYSFPTDIRLQGKSNAEQVHNVILRMLKILSIICENNNILFWLDYGTMLGAVRHKGFIPWDTEADIGMLRKDYNKLKTVVENSLPNDIFFQTQHTDPLYLSSSKYIEAKLRDRCSNYIGFQNRHPEYQWHNGIQIDIFIYDLVSIEEKICIMNNFEKTLTGGASFFLPDELHELVSVPFCDTEFYIPKGYDVYLKRNYRNYMDFPPIENQVYEPVDLINACNHPASIQWQSDRMN